jgi:hypothetical protein
MRVKRSRLVGLRGHTIQRSDRFPHIVFDVGSNTPMRTTSTCLNVVATHKD